MSSLEINFESMFPNKKKLEIYIRGNHSLSIQDKYGDTLFMFVVKSPNYTDIALQMLSYGPDALHLRGQNKNGQTALSIACILHLKEIILKMLDFGPDAIFINSRDNFNDTPIMDSIKEAKKNSMMIEIIDKMLDFGPSILDLSIVNNKGYTALMLACKYELSDIVSKMLDSYSRQYYDLNLFQENDQGETALDISARNNLQEISNLISERMREEEHNQMDIPMNSNNNSAIPNTPAYSNGTMPSLSYQDIQKYQQNHSFTIDLDQDGFDPFLLDNQNILSYLKEDLADHIAIKYNNKVYLSKRSILAQQKTDATVFECLKAIKNPANIVFNLPLFNIKKIGINLSSDTAVGIEPEYIYMDGIDKIIHPRPASSSSSIQENLFTILAITNKILVSVISLEEVKKIGSDFAGASSLHCQPGQGGLAGIIVGASSLFTKGGLFHKGGKRKSRRRKSLKKGQRKSLKKIKLRKIK